MTNETWPTAPHPRRSRSWRTLLASVLASLTILFGLTSVAQANVIQALPQNASGLEQTFSPAYDYDTDGCYATAAISPNGSPNPGLQIGGSLTNACRGIDQLNNSNTYSRSRCNNGWCAIEYASYFEKDQATNNLGPVAGGGNGHVHDFEHVVVWVQNNTVQYVSVSQHDTWETQDRAHIRFDGTHPKIVYNKDGASTHDFRFANAGDDAVENATGNWFYPRLVGWEGYPSEDFRNQFIYHTSYGAATIKIGTGSFENQLSFTEYLINIHFRGGLSGGNTLPFNPEVNELEPRHEQPPITVPSPREVTTPAKPPFADCPADSACFYQHAVGMGSKLIVPLPAHGADPATRHDLRGQTFLNGENANDQISSFYSPRCTVHIYTDIDRGGSQAYSDHPYNDLGNTWFNDLGSSIAIWC